MKKSSISFVSPHAYPVIAGGDFQTAGGAEIQQWLLAQELADKGYRVSFVVGDFGQLELESIKGIQFHRSYRLFHGNGKVRYPANMFLLMRAMSRADADIYYQRAGMFYTGPVALFTSLKRRKFIYSAGHDRNCNPELQSGMSNFIRRFYRFGLKKADLVTAQSEYQKKLFKRYYGVESVVVKNGFHIRDVQFRKRSDNTVLWVAKAHYWKRPELFLELARRIPDVIFDMVCAPAQQYLYYEKLKGDAKKIPNLRFHGFIPIDKIDSFFEKATVFVNTSSSEGFPNTFLQAWARYVPVVTLKVDPDKCVNSNEIGFCSESFDRLVNDVKTLINDKFLREKMGKAGREYIEAEHDISKIGENFSEILGKL
jgi:glycosyltransferase involved in cell wall biosynthesis